MVELLKTYIFGETKSTDMKNITIEIESNTENLQQLLSEVSEHCSQNNIDTKQVKDITVWIGWKMLDLKFVWEWNTKSERLEIIGLGKNV